MNNERMEELAALHAMNLLDEAGKKELLEAIRHNPQVGNLARDLSEIAALLTHEAPEVVPPPQLKRDIMRHLPVRKASSKIILFPEWVGYAIAACLMALGIFQALQIVQLKGQVQGLKSTLLAKDSEVNQLQQTNTIKDLRLAVLERAAAGQADTAYASSSVMVAWDPVQHRGILSMKDLPAPPPGHDYQLWVLDPKVATPISAGLLTGSRPFAVNPPSTPNPGFAISLEPTGGRPTPTGPILFAFAPPGQ